MGSRAPWDIDHLVETWDSGITTSFRPADLTDIQLLITLSRETIASSYGARPIDHRWRVGHLDEYLRSSLRRCSVMIVNEVTVGLSVAKENQIEFLLVSHELHRRGLGSALLRHTESELFRRHAELQLRLVGSQRTLRDFFLKHGWRLLSDPVAPVADGDTFLMSKLQDVDEENSLAALHAPR